ncbi:hypothetical protein COV82_02250 [Candidatus Peregrinibacteria bacterium CG11_big_fil_rev_8_21_14_0_20_46_8]|nr:MAG: hypothetical protein COV82_02250 [Candidatus Peregrinibacteria bacterium CG11_big_fil_rev_8_21_14_0_20_46_8]
MFQFLFNLFSHYAHPFEKKADRFFRSVRSTSSSRGVQKKLEGLMQENLAVLNLWLEKRYKNYKYLNKRTRRKMYKDLELLKQAFERFTNEHTVQPSAIAHTLKILHLKMPPDMDKMIYLAKMMHYLRPGAHYEYQAGANFGKLLRDPRHQKLIGDCNQIVTLYVFLYAQKYPVGDLHIKLLPEHVCLHFQGVDIEATNGTFQNYKDFEALLPITELIPTNLLDIADIEAQQAHVDPRAVVKAAQLAVLVSSQRSIVERNLKIAYRNLGILLMHQHEYESAIFYFAKLGDHDLITAANHNAAIYFLKKYKYREALHYALKTKDFELERAIYLKQYNLLAQKVEGVTTVSAARNKRSIYRKMRDLARKAKDRELEKSIQKILDDIR